MLDLRRATLADLPALLRLVNRAYRPAQGEGGWTHESALLRGERINLDQLSALVAGPGEIWLGGRAGVLLACVYVEPGPDHGYVGMLAVEPACQDGGLGSAMLACAEARLRDVHGLPLARMSVISARPELRAFYLRRGYQPTGERLPFPMDAGAGRLLQPGLALEVLQKPLIS